VFATLEEGIRIVPEHQALDAELPFQVGIELLLKLAERLARSGFEAVH
jgi:hypothetical protein